MTTRSALIAEYLCNGGLFNPEMMDHDKVRNLIIDVRKDVEEIEAIREFLWPNQTGLPNEYRSVLLAITARERLANKAPSSGSDGLISLLREKGGAIVSSNDCSPMEIADARATDRFWVDENGFGFVWRSPEWLALHKTCGASLNSK